MSTGCFHAAPQTEIQLPALFVMRKQPVFFTFSKYLGGRNLPMPLGNQMIVLANETSNSRLVIFPEGP